MKTGEIIIVSFPFTNLHEEKARPAVIVSTTNDAYQDVVVCMISSIVPTLLNNQQVLLIPSAINNLRSESVIKIARICTLQKSKVIASIGKLDAVEMKQFVQSFKSLID